MSPKKKAICEQQNIYKYKKIKSPTFCGDFEC